MVEIITAAVAIFLGLMAILTGVLAWMIRKILNIKDEVDIISASYGGSQFSEGHLEETRQNFQRIENHLNDLADSLSYYNRKRQEDHDRIGDKIESIAEV